MSQSLVFHGELSFIIYSGIACLIMENFRWTRKLIMSYRKISNIFNIFSNSKECIKHAEKPTKNSRSIFVQWSDLAQELLSRSMRFTNLICIFQVLIANKSYPIQL